MEFEERLTDAKQNMIIPKNNKDKPN